MKKFLATLMIAAISFGAVTSTFAFQTKKDGSKDMRYKENKKPKGPVTKSGKADMRYKSNNAKAGKKKTS
jgi:hypothetical protein